VVKLACGSGPLRLSNTLLPQRSCAFIKKICLARYSHRSTGSKIAHDYKAASAVVGKKRVAALERLIQV
jgi:hypothetical protein